MIDFLTSMSWAGCALILSITQTLWRPPTLLREVFNGDAVTHEKPMRLGEGLPRMDPSAPFYTGASQAHTTPGTDT